MPATRLARVCDAGGDTRSAIELAGSHPRNGTSSRPRSAPPLRQAAERACVYRAAVRAGRHTCSAAEDGAMGTVSSHRVKLPHK
jgi:hypothetical protein